MKSIMLFSAILFFVFIFGCLDLQPATPAPVVPENVTVQLCVDDNKSTTLFEAGFVMNGSEVIKDKCADQNTVLKFSCVDGSVFEETKGCGSGYNCSEGKCVVLKQPDIIEPLCNDSDSGREYYEAGTLSIGHSNFSDTCQGTSHLVEYYCEDDSKKSEVYACPPGDRCSDGACERGERVCTENDADNQSRTGSANCQNDSLTNVTMDCESDRYCYEGSCAPLCQDGELLNDPAVLYNGTYFFDKCEDDDKLTDYSCSGDNLRKNEISCPNYCLDNQCLMPDELTCEKYYYGIKLSSKDQVLGYFSNSCLDYKTAKTYICDQNTPVALYDACANDEICKYGECSRITYGSCFESDAGRNEISVKSYAIETYASSVKEIKNDECFTNKMVTEYYCKDNKIYGEQHFCADEDICKDGACVFPYTCQYTPRTSSSAAVVTLYEAGKYVRKEQDLCASESALRQVSCNESGHILYELVVCPKGTKCDIEEGMCK
jgi:hypothetical protein